MGLTLREAREACPQRLPAKSRLERGLRKRGVVFPEMTESPRAKQYRRRRGNGARLSLRAAIRQRGAQVSPQAVRYRIEKMGLSLEEALNLSVMDRREAGRRGGWATNKGAHVLEDGQTCFRFYRIS